MPFREAEWALGRVRNCGKRLGWEWPDLSPEIRKSFPGAPFRGRGSNLSSSWSPVLSEITLCILCFPMSFSLKCKDVSTSIH